VGVRIPPVPDLRPLARERAGEEEDLSHHPDAQRARGASSSGEARSPGRGPFLERAMRFELDLTSTVTIRKREHTVAQAIDRQVAHYAYHVGQIVCLARMLAKESWQPLRIPRGQSGSYEPKGRI